MILTQDRPLCVEVKLQSGGISVLKGAQLSGTYNHRPTENSFSFEDGPFEFETEEPLNTVASNCPM